jgi:hypothetical protein
MSSPDEIARRLQAQVEAECPMTLSLDGPGPFEFPKCGSKVSAIAGKGEIFVLELETEERCQRLLLPISVQALGALKATIDHMVASGVGRPRN